MVATSATRDAANRDVFFAMTADVLGAVVPGAVAEVITGDEEAELSFRGAVGELDVAAGPFVVVDLGGGSTEVVLGEREMQAGYSADIGCVRLTERCLHTDPPTAVEVAAAREVVRERLGEALRVVPVERARTWVGVAGTMTTLSALAQRMTTYDPAAIHLSRVGFGELLPVCEEIIAMTHDQRAALGPMHEGRVDVIGGGRHHRRGTGGRLGPPGRHRRAGGQRARHPRRHRAVHRLGANLVRPWRFARVALARERHAQQQHAHTQSEVQPVVGVVQRHDVECDWPGRSATRITTARGRRAPPTSR